MKLTDVEDSNENVPRYKDGDCSKISTYRNAFAKRYTQNCSEEFFIISKI